jgi:NhaP-type Na+/H+ or K+/H+ antiporter
MNLSAIALILGAVFLWALVSARARIVTAPIFFTAVGLLLAEGVRLLHVAPDPHAIKVLAELTLVWVLFADASRIRTSVLRHDASRYLRLLGIGLPATVLLGTLVAAGLLGLSPWYALLLGAALAPTDAALGAPVMSDLRVPYRIRQTLNVESGLNDGIATPVVTTALAAIAVSAGQEGQIGLVRALLGLPLGVLVGVVLGGGGGIALRWSHRRGWGAEEIAGPALLALALVAFAVAGLLLANGYVAAFVAGGVFGRTAGRGGETEVYYVEQTCGLASMLCWTLFGAVAVPLLAEDWNWRILVYALLSLTLIRMVPVAVSLIGAHLSRRSVAFVGWFGPRGLASVVFALLAAEDLHGLPGPVDDVVATIGLTVLLSVVLHGLSARPLVGWYAAGELAEESESSAEVSVRHLAGPRRPDSSRSPDRSDGPDAVG